MSGWTCGHLWQHGSCSVTQDANARFGPRLAGADRITIVSLPRSSRSALSALNPGIRRSRSLTCGTLIFALLRRRPCVLRWICTIHAHEAMAERTIVCTLAGRL